MAAEVLATAGLRVTVVEHMPSVGRKLLLAGRSGLNLTHSEPIEAMLGRYGPRRHRLEQAIDAFGPADLRAWCVGLGEPTFVGSSASPFSSSPFAPAYCFFSRIRCASARCADAALRGDPCSDAFAVSRSPSSFSVSLPSANRTYASSVFL